MSSFQADVPAKTLLTSLTSMGPPPAQHPSASLPPTQHPPASLPPTQHPSASAPPHPSPAKTPAPVEKEVETLLPSFSEIDPSPYQPVATGDHTTTSSSPQTAERLAAVASPCQPAVLTHTEAKQTVPRDHHETSSSGPSHVTMQPSSSSCASSSSSSSGGDASLQEVLESPGDEGTSEALSPPQGADLTLFNPDSIRCCFLTAVRYMVCISPFPGLEVPSVELCEQVAQELRQSVQRVLNLHHQVSIEG